MQRGRENLKRRFYGDRDHDRKILAQPPPSSYCTLLCPWIRRFSIQQLSLRGGFVQAAN